MYYDVTHAITNATPTNPNSQDAVAYDEERVHDAVRRLAPKLNVANDGTDNLYVVVSHGGEQTFSPEQVIFPGDIKEYLDVYSLRLRSPTAGLPYRVSEYDIHRTCCPIDIENIDQQWIHAVEVTAPLAGSTLITKTVSVGKSGYIYGFLVSTQEANDFKLNWTSGGVSKSIRLVFGGAGSAQDTETIPLNEGLPADATTNITITNINAGAAGIKYQARLLFKEA